jgi:hypothetical protein
LSLLANILVGFLFMTASPGPECAATSEVLAAHLQQEITLNAAHPSPWWKRAQPITFCEDWQGANPDAGRQTQVRALWSKETLYLRFECRYRELFVFEDSDSNGRRDRLWERDVVEVFLQPDPSRPSHYKEFEVSPNGMWLDLDIFPGGRADLNSGLLRSVSVDAAQHAWAAELAVPINSLTSNFTRGAVWRANFFRVEGPPDRRSYYSWQPTRTSQPNFHVPEVFGELRFAPAPR